MAQKDKIELRRTTVSVRILGHYEFGTLKNS